MKTLIPGFSNVLAIALVMALSTFYVTDAAAANRGERVFHDDAEIVAMEWSKKNNCVPATAAFAILIPRATLSANSFPFDRLEKHYLDKLSQIVDSEKIGFFYEITDYKNPFGTVFVKGFSDGPTQLSDLPDVAIKHLTQGQWENSMPVTRGC